MITAGSAGPRAASCGPGASPASSASNGVRRGLASSAPSRPAGSVPTMYSEVTAAASAALAASSTKPP